MAQEQIARLPSRGEWRLWDVVLMIIIALSPLLFFRDALFRDKAAILWDAYTQFYAVWDTIARNYHAGKLPLWLPSIMNGVPLVGDPQAQLFYLLNLPFFLFGDFSPLHIYMQLAAHTALAGVGLYLLSRHLCRSRPAAAIAALSYMYSGFMIGHLSHPQMLETAAWLPLVILCFSLLMERLRPRLIALSAAVLALAYFAGHPPTAFYLSLFLAAFAAWKIFVERPGPLWRSAFGFLAAAALGVLLYSVQLLPTIEAWRLGERSRPRTFQEAVDGGMWFAEELVALIDPNHFNVTAGSYWGSYEMTQHFMYLGVGTFFLLPFGIYAACRRRRVTPMFMLVALTAALAYCLGGSTPFYRWCFDWLPFIDLFRAPAYGSFIFFFCGALLAGTGWDSLARVCAERRRGVLAALLLASFAVAALLWLGSPAGPPPLDGIPWASRLDAGAGNAADGTGRALFLLGVKCSAVAAMAALLYAFKGRRILLGVLAPILVFIDLFMAGADSSLTGFGRSSSEISSPLPFEKEIGDLSRRALEEGSPFRLFVIKEGWLMSGNVPIRSDIQLANGITALPLLRRAPALEDLWLCERDDQHCRRNNVRFVRHEAGLREVNDPFPRAYLIGHESDGPNLKVFYGVNKIVVRADGAITGTVNLLETYYPAWRARAGERELQVEPTERGFMSVRLEAPASEIEFSFEPRAFRVGALTTIVGMIIAAALCVMRPRRSHTKKGALSWTPPDSPAASRATEEG